jgi:hypothetical protein
LIHVGSQSCTAYVFPIVGKESEIWSECHS